MAKASDKTQVKKIGVRLVLSWVFGTIFVIGGSLDVFLGRTYKIFDVLAGLVIFPPAVGFIRNKYKFELSTPLKLILFVTILIIGLIASFR
jgi:fructose-1,6-bisphosphatase/inositol monophosphatase family enzyme